MAGENNNSSVLVEELKKKPKKRRKDDVDKEKSSKNKKQKRDSSPTGNVLRLLPSKPLRKPLKFPHKYILAPMVGASELAFRLLCRKYGAQLAYTPMMSAHNFAYDDAYRHAEFQTCPADRPLVCHFSANTVSDFVAAAQKAEPFCDAIDLNLGCPQRTAYLGHFGSYLLDPEDRPLICSMVRGAAQTVAIPIFCKIRLLNTLEETIQLCQQLKDAGASLIAIHARYRASWERKGPGARDGPAILEQVTAIRKVVTEIPIVANGNTITWKDVQDNLALTGADGLMSAEGILDDPALFLPRYGSRENASNAQVAVYTLKEESNEKTYSDVKKKKLEKKLAAVTDLERKMQLDGENSLTDKERKKVSKKAKIQKKLEAMFGSCLVETKMSLLDLYSAADDKLEIANEYLQLASKYPVKTRSIIFHTRRILKEALGKFQLMDECLQCETVHDVQTVVNKIRYYLENPSAFVFDREKAKKEKEALERKKQEEGKRKAYEARMIRKAKREQKPDLMFYLHVGAKVPTIDKINALKKHSRAQALELWKKDHSQHCFAFHLDESGCSRGRGCAFLHVDATGLNTFVETDEVAG